MLTLPFPFNGDRSCAVQLSTLPLPLTFNVEVRTWDGYLRRVRKQSKLKAPRVSNPTKVSFPCSRLNIECEGQGECGESNCTGTVIIEWKGVVQASDGSYPELQIMFSVYLSDVWTALFKKALAPLARCDKEVCFFWHAFALQLSFLGLKAALIIFTSPPFFCCCHPTAQSLESRI